MKVCPYCAEEIQDAAIVCKHCRRDLRTETRSPYELSLATAGMPAVSPPPPTVTAPSKPKRRIGCLGIVGIAFATIVALGMLGAILGPSPPTTSTTSSQGTLIVGDKPAPTPPPVAKPYEDLEARVRFNGRQFTITNIGSVGWTDVKCELNGGIFSGGYDLQADDLAAGRSVTVGAMQFAKSDGTRFNPFQMKPQKLTIRAKVGGRDGFYFGEWQ